jgi:hypothetical protein
MPEVDEQLGPLQQEVCNHALADTAPRIHSPSKQLSIFTAVKCVACQTDCDLQVPFGMLCHNAEQ